MRILLPTVGVAAMLLSACQQDRTPATDAATPSRAPSDQRTAAKPEPVPDANTAVMDYTCEGGHGVVIVAGGDIARVTLKGGRVIDLPRDSSHTPPLYAGDALEFAVTSDGGMLGQDEIGGSACQSAV